MRKQITATLIFLACAAALLAGGAALASPKKVAIPLDKIEKLKEIDGWAILKVKELEIMFIRDAEESVRAFHPVCTHQKCKLGYNPKKKEIECPCHESAFDLEGKPLKGPAKEPLKRYEAKLEGGRIIVTLE